MEINLKDLIINPGLVTIKDKILLSGTIYTVRDIAHKKITEILDSNEPHKLPFALLNSAIYYCGPTPAKPGSIIGACGPTTSKRMDFFTPKLLKNGVKFLIGKGDRSRTVINSIKEKEALYFVATGGIAALLARTVKKIELIAFKNLGPEAIYKLEVKNMPLIVAIDSFGKNIFNR
jgi:fumarate hydratase subunit beta